jgi:hypothetical protein
VRYLLPAPLAPPVPPLAPPVPPLAPPVPPLAPPVPPPAVPPDAPDVPPLDAPPLVDPLAAPEVPPVVPPPVPLPLSALPPPLLERVVRPGTVEMPEFVLLGLLLRTQSARAVPVRPAHDAFGVLFELLCRQSASAVPVIPAQLLDGLAVLVPVEVDGDVVDIDDDVSAAKAAPAAASDVAKTSAFIFHNFIDPSET